MGAIDVIHPLSGEFDPTLLWQATPCRYVSTNGSDANDGLTLYSPMLTIQAGIDSLAAVANGRPSTVFIAGGVYAENVLLKLDDGGVGDSINLAAMPEESVMIRPAAGIGLAIDPVVNAGDWVVRGLLITGIVAGSPAVSLVDANSNAHSVIFDQCFVLGAAAHTEAVLVDSVNVTFRNSRVQTTVSGQDCFRVGGVGTDSGALTLHACGVLPTDAVGVLVDHSDAAATLRDCTIQGGGASNDYAVQTDAGQIVAYNTDVAVAEGRAIRANTGSEITWFDSRITASADAADTNLVRGEGPDALVTLYDCFVEGAEGGTGRGVTMTGGAGFIAYNCEINAARYALNITSGSRGIVVNTAFTGNGDANHEVVRVHGDNVGPIGTTSALEMWGNCSIEFSAGPIVAYALLVDDFAICTFAGYADGTNGSGDIDVDADSALAFRPLATVQTPLINFAATSTFLHETTAEDGLTIPLLDDTGAPGTYDLLGSNAGGDGVTYRGIRAYGTLEVNFTVAPTGAGNVVIRIVNVDTAASVTFTTTGVAWEELTASGAFLVLPGERLRAEIVVPAGMTSGHGYFVLRQ